MKFGAAKIPKRAFDQIPKIKEKLVEKARKEGDASKAIMIENMGVGALIGFIIDEYGQHVQR